MGFDGLALRVFAANHRRREMEFEARAALECCRDLLCKRPVAIKPGDLIFVFDRKQLKVIARTGVREVMTARYPCLLNLIDVFHQRQIALGIGFVLIGLKKCGASLDRFVEGPRLHLRRGVSSQWRGGGFHRGGIGGFATAP